MTYVAVGNGREGQTGQGNVGDTLQEGGHARAPRARARGSITAALSVVTQRVGESRAQRQSPVTEDGSPDKVRGRSPWQEGAATPAGVLAYTRAGDWVPGEQEVWLERLGKAYGYLALLITVAVTYPLWIVQRPSRFALASALLGLLWLTWSAT